METKNFKASLDTTSKFISAAMVIFSVAQFVFFMMVLKEDRIFGLVPLLILSPLLGVTYFYSPTSYSVNDDSISVNRLAGKFVLKKDEIYSIQAITKKELGFVWRMFGNGGMFGYTGWFKTSIGAMRWFVSQRKNYVAIKMKNGKLFLISPDDPEGFLLATLL